MHRKYGPERLTIEQVSLNKLWTKHGEHIRKNAESIWLFTFPNVFAKYIVFTSA